MKKTLLSLGLMAVAASMSAVEYIPRAVLTQVPTQETKVIIEGWTMASKGFMTVAPSGVSVFSVLDKSDANRAVFAEEYVYTLVPVEGSTTDFYLKDANGLYAPVGTADMNTGGGLAQAGTPDIASAGTYKFGAAEAITTAAYADKYMFTNTNQNASGKTRMEVHFKEDGGVFKWCYLQTASGGMTDAGASGRTAAAFKVYVAEEKTVDPVEVTLNYPSFGDFTPISVTVSLFPGEVLSSQIPSVDFFNATGTDGVVTPETTSLNVTGEWAFPFALDNVYRLNIRSKGTRFVLGSDGNIATDSADGAKFDPNSLFYFKGHGFNSDNRLLVTFHTIACPDSEGLYVANENNAKATFTAEPTQWTVKASTQGSNGIVLQHPENASAHVNDVTNKVGLWTAAASLTDNGSCIRFFSLSDTDFQTTTWTHNDREFTFASDKMATVQANQSSENLRALFDFQSTVTINKKYNGQLIGEPEQITGYIGDAYTASTPAFFSDVISGTIPDNDATIDVELTQLTLPFKYTATTDNMIWQAVQQHYWYKNTELEIDGADNKIRFTWTYSAPESNNIVESEPADVATNGFADTQLWAFVGNYPEGFKIYNKAAGTGMWVYADGEEVKVGTGADHNLWTIHPTNDYSTDEYCALKTNGTEFINLNVSNDLGTHLNFWSAADNGSTIWFVAPAEPMLEHTSGYLVNYDGPANAVGAPIFDDLNVDEISTAIANAEADKYNLDAAEALRRAIADYDAQTISRIELNPAVWYRIKSAHWDGQYVYTSATDDAIVGGNDNHLLNYHTVFAFEPVPAADDAEENAEMRYYVKSQGRYVGHTVEGQNVSQVDADGERGEYIITHDVTGTNCAQASLKDMASTTEKRSWHKGNGNNGSNITGWGQWAGGSHFYVIPAETVDVQLPELIDGMHVGFGYFPFPVKAADGTRLYYVHHGTDNVTKSKVVSYAEVQTVPAHTAFMISHEESNVASLVIDYPGIALFAASESTTPDNILDGSLRATTALPGDYILGDTADGGRGFVKSTEAPAVSGNSVFLPASALPENFRTEVELPFNAPGQTTSISEIGIDNSAAAGAIYDLQGRRLAAPIKGINIVNGKKVLIK